MIRYICKKKGTTETKEGKFFDVWLQEAPRFREVSRVGNARVGKPEDVDPEWKHFRVDERQFNELEIEKEYGLAAVR